MSEPLEWTLEDGVATVTITDAEGRNTLTPDIVTAAHDALDSVADAACLVVAGAGETFCAGGDLEGIVAGARGELSEAAFVDRLERIDALIERLYGFPAPTVAAVDGPAFGAGGALALACDVVVASEDGSIGFGFHRVGMPVGAGVSTLLPTAVGESRAAELLYTGELLDAERAKELGLFKRVFPTGEFEERLDAFVETVASGPPEATRETGQLLTANGPQSLHTAMEAERAARRRRFGTSEHVEGAGAFIDQREPAFENE
ncbi:Enoyl-CoA hydratase protein [Halorhabdus tiamatea SARL4B]|uniref:Enoyl-CoA hydratase n=1 Tax=Halorhabdus tiamatea SARL4B TaxID=1033806 RepID=F7PIB0_9EURY|nr:enoyl-CoA hydratase-related protein [Halorhabdus tiamatea]ERJ05215.1 Enoyl-CoA hydratase protein [Halorhabdus tiamatea SARL4B]CCQ34880.1 enoyl-CoA hydratase [Halorhabdus tiamatea SARL4B]